MASQDVKIVRILLVGDPQCGKTSIILALVGEEFPLFVPPRAEEITIPGDVTPEKVPTHIVDFCAKEQSDDILHEEIAKAHVVCVIYDVTQDDALDRVTGYWLPLIKQCTASPDVAKPVILAGNKSDLPHDVDGQAIRLQDILNTYLEVETGIECSAAKNLRNVSELFYFAQKAVLHPTAPLYSVSDGAFKPACVSALERIFKISDIDNDGILNDQELNDFQIRCFDAPLQPNALQDVKVMVQRHVPEGVLSEGLTLEGFLFLNQLFVLKGKHESTWKVLRKFGYNNSLVLKDDYLTPVFSPQPGSTVELSKTGYRFLSDLFEKHDKDGDQALSPQEQEDLFSLCPEFMWDDQFIQLTVETNKEGWITIGGFLAFWTLQTCIDYTVTAQFLAWMGYSNLENRPLASTLREVPPHDRHKKVYQCHVMGGTGCGKSSFVRGLINKPMLLVQDNEEEEEELVELMCVKAVTVKGTHVYLVLQESCFDPLEQQRHAEAIGGTAAGNATIAAHLDKCDVVCLLYDSSNKTSFNCAAKLFNLIDSSVSDLIPCVFVASKSDLPRVQQEGVEHQPNEFCREVGLPLPVNVSCQQTESLSVVYERLAAVAINPSANIPSAIRIPRWLKLTCVGLLMSAGLGSLVYLLIRLGRLRISRS